MRVGMIMDTSFPPDARVENEAITLIKNGYEVVLFHIDYERKPDRDEHNGIQIFRIHAGQLLYKLSALVYTIPVFSRVVKSRVDHFISEYKPDLLHIHDMVIADSVFKANQKYQLPVVLDLHENRPEIMKLYKHVNQWPGNWLINLEKWKEKQREFMERADHVILVTEEAKTAANINDRIPLEKITAVPNVVRFDRFDTDITLEDIVEITANRFTLLYIGDTSIRRGTLTALEALERIKNIIPELQLLLVGNSSQDEQLRELIDRKNLNEYVRFEGWQPPERLPAYINASELCLSPLLRNPHHDTTYANKLFQYMAAGKAVIASDCPAQKTVIENENCGLIHKAGDPDDLADKIRELYENPEKRIKMGRNGAEAVRKRWNWDVTGKKLLQAYQKTPGAIVSLEGN
jgi:glycosyltransferase involved in cell wall biosynthesis